MTLDLRLVTEGNGSTTENTSVAHEVDAEPIRRGEHDPAGGGANGMNEVDGSAHSDHAMQRVCSLVGNELNEEGAEGRSPIPIAIGR